MLKSLLRGLTGVFFAIQLHAQSSNLQKGDSVLQIPAPYLDKVSSKANQLEQKIDDKTDKVLLQMMKQEEKMKKKLAKIDPAKANEVFGNIEEKYNNFKERLKDKVSDKQYIPSLDSLSTALKFLQQNPQLVSQMKDGEQKIKDVLRKVNGLEDKFQQAEEIKKFLRERKQILKDRLSELGFARQLKKINKQVYYYSQQVNEYKEILKDKTKIEKKALELLSKAKPFRDFMRRNSELASLFHIPVDVSDPSAMTILTGLQTRVQVNNLIQQQIGTGGPDVRRQLGQNMQAAHIEFDQFKNKISQWGRNGDLEMPEGFTPNSQKTKSFRKRLEYGTNFQSQRATNLFPTTIDIGLSVGYKLNDKSIIGIGASYKVGLGSGWNHIRVTHQGVGLRSFVDWKIKGSFWFTGGYEQNYKSTFKEFAELKNENAWQVSGLLGLSKVISLKTKLFKKTKIQLLWDFLSYKQKPITQPVLFRIGYNF